MGNYSMLHIYCGNGKGKTTSAVGLAVRMAGSGAKVLFVQLLKDGKSSEISILNKIDNITVIGKSPVEKFSFNMNEQEKEICLKYNNSLVMDAIKKAAKSYDCLIIDECFGAINAKLLTENILLDFVKSKPLPIEVVLTGRNPSKSMIEAADYISEITKIKHPYDKGVTARKGIEK